MQLSWKEFDIDLPSFKRFLDENVEKADGIVATEDSFVIVEREAFEQSDIDAVQGYYDALTEEDEALKISRPARLIVAINAAREDLLSANWSQLTQVQRKLLAVLPLTTEEEDQIIADFS